LPYSGSIRTGEGKSAIFLVPLFMVIAIKMRRRKEPPTAPPTMAPTLLEEARATVAASID
jgi:hypothetical protein